VPGHCWRRRGSPRAPTGFQRNKPIILKRVRSNQIANPAAYEPWGWRDGVWAWGNPATPILSGRFGELCLRPLGGKWVLTWFDADDYRIDGIIMDTPTSNLYTDAVPNPQLRLSRRVPSGEPPATGAVGKYEVIRHLRSARTLVLRPAG
jgi:hypothetical protein